MSSDVGSLGITLTDDEMREAQQLAEQTLKVFAKEWGHYNNTLNSHLRGKVGEIAVARWLETNGVRVDPLFRDTGKGSQCDIVASDARKLRLDVKTWDKTYWAEMGRCVAVDQLKKLRTKADGILWCVSSPKLVPGVEVELVGWNWMDDVAAAPRRMTGPAGRRQVDNHQVDADKLRRPTDLLAILKLKPGADP